MNFSSVCGCSPLPRKQSPNSARLPRLFSICPHWKQKVSLKASNTRCTPCLCAQPGAILHHPVIPLHSPIKYMSFQSSPPKAFLKSPSSLQFPYPTPTRYYLHLQGTRPSLLQPFFLYLYGRTIQLSPALIPNFIASISSERLNLFSTSHGIVVSLRSLFPNLCTSCPTSGTEKFLILRTTLS